MDEKMPADTLPRVREKIEYNLIYSTIFKVMEKYDEEIEELC